MVASETDRDLIYFTFNDEQTVENLKQIIEIIEKHNFNVSQVYKLINEYADEIRHTSVCLIFCKPKINFKSFGLSEFLKTKFGEAEQASKL